MFFDVAGHGLVHYAIGTGWLVLLAAAAALAVAYAGVARRGSVAPVDVAQGAGAGLWLAIHALLGLTAFNLLSGSGRHPNYYDRLAALSMLEAQAVLVGLAVLLGFLLLRRARFIGLLPTLLLALFCWKQGGPHGLILLGTLAALAIGWFAPPRGVTRWGGWLGAIALVLLVAIGLQVKAPLAAWIFAWPALVLGIAAVLVAWTDATFVRPTSVGDRRDRRGDRRRAAAAARASHLSRHRRPARARDGAVPARPRRRALAAGEDRRGTALALAAIALLLLIATDDRAPRARSPDRADGARLQPRQIGRDHSVLS